MREPLGDAVRCLAIHCGWRARRPLRGGVGLSVFISGSGDAVVGRARRPFGGVSGFCMWREEWSLDCACVCGFGVAALMDWIVRDVIGRS